MKTSTMLGLAALSLGLALPSAFAKPQEADGNKRGGPRMERRNTDDRRERMFKELNLTPEQKEKLKAHREANRQRAETLRQAMRAKREAMRLELEKPDFKADRARALHEDLKKLQAQAADARFNGILEVRQILTPEQFQKFHQLTRQRMEERRADRGQPDRRRGPPMDEDDDMR